MQTRALFYVLAIGFFFLPGCKDGPEPGCTETINGLTINQLQVLGSHNSYRLRTFDPLLQYIYDNPPIIPGGFNPDDWDYTHVPLDVQFETYNIRSIELDVYYDPNGGLFYNRIGNIVLGLDPASGEPALLEPGLKILHFPDVDYLTNYLTFKSALAAVKNWSDAHPDHLPVVVMVEPKEDNLFDVLGAPFTPVMPFNITALDAIDQEIRDVFGDNLSKVFTPDDLRGNYATLNEAIKHNNWPTLDQVRGQLLFVMLPSADERLDYMEVHPTLEGRAMFLFSFPNSPETAFLNYDDPLGNFADIQEKVKEGYFVRTRADADTQEARTGNTTRRDAAFASGAQIIATDYYRPDPRSDTSAAWTNYVVRLPVDGPAIMNPLTGLPDYADCPIREH